MINPCFSSIPPRKGRWKIGAILLVLLSPFAVAQETRPAGNTGTGFFTKNGKIFDKTGAEFVARGINHTLWWGDEAHNHESITSPTGLVKTGANSIRAVFGPGGGADTPVEMRLEVQSIINQKMVPIVERHDATGNDTATNDIPLQQIVDNVWLAPANVQMLKDFEDRIILNIANEWGPNSTVWRDAYKTAVAKLRKAGVNCLILIDAGGDFGQNYRSVMTYGADIVNSDPQHNVAFSIHMYGFWVSQNRNAALAGTWGPPDNDPFLIESAMNQLRSAGFSVLIGEFSSDAASEVLYKTQDLLNYCQTNRVGWVAWSWNQNADGPHPMDMLGYNGSVSKWLYNTDADLTAFGTLIVKGQNGLLQTSVKANIFGGSVPPPPPPPPPPGPDVIPPSVPTGVHAVNLSSTSFILSWTGSTDNVGVVGYDIFRNNVLIESSVPVTNFMINGLTPTTNYSFTVRARDAAGNQSPASPVLSVTTTPSEPTILPAPWASQDIGNVTTPGVASDFLTGWMIDASGADIWGTSDQFRYAYQPLSGSGQITVRLQSMIGTNPWAKAGVMVRQSVAAGAAYVNFCATPGNGIVLQRRAVANGVSDMPSSTAGSIPCWLRLVRNGNTFSAFRSTNGQTWTASGTTTCVMTGPVLIGMSVCAHSTTATTEAVFDNVVVSAAVPPPVPPPTTVPPPTAGTKVISLDTLPAGALANPYNDASGYTLAGAFSSTSAPEPLMVKALGANKVLINSNWDSKITLTKTGGGTFNLVSFRYASDPWGGVADATVTGTTATGGTVTSSYSATSLTLQTLTLNWTNLTKVVIDFSGGANGSYGMVDDIALSSSAAAP